MLASAQVSILALKYFVFFFREFSLYAKFVTRCCGASNLVSACVDFICICRQNESSLEFNLYLIDHLMDLVQKLYPPSIDVLLVFLILSYILTHFSCSTNYRNDQTCGNSYIGIYWLDI